MKTNTINIELKNLEIGNIVNGGKKVVDIQVNEDSEIPQTHLEYRLENEMSWTTGHKTATVKISA